MKPAAIVLAALAVLVGAPPAGAGSDADGAIAIISRLPHSSLLEANLRVRYSCDLSDSAACDWFPAASVYPASVALCPDAFDPSRGIWVGEPEHGATSEGARVSFDPRQRRGTIIVCMYANDGSSSYSVGQKRFVLRKKTRLSLFVVYDRHDAPCSMAVAGVVNGSRVSSGHVVMTVARRGLHTLRVVPTASRFRSGLGVTLGASGSYRVSARFEGTTVWAPSRRVTKRVTVVGCG